MIDRELVFIAGGLRAGSLPTRPAALASEFAASRAFTHLLMVERRRPWNYLASRVASAIHPRGDGEPGHEREVVEHPWPFGPLERRFVLRLVRSLPADAIVWIADPKSTSVFRDLQGLGPRRPLLVFDAYDAWDLSPLVRGTRRLEAVRDGYRAAAEAADVVFANTPFMAERMRASGATEVHLLPNGAPTVKRPPMVSGDASPDRPYLLYVGRVHERVDAGLVHAVAAALPGVAVRIVGPIEREPPGWPELVRLPNVEVLGPRSGAEARSLMAGSTACLVPHVVDDYARSQDAMKAWDALAVGALVISTGVPPASSWPAGLGLVAEDPDAFVEAARQAVAGTAPGSPESRRAFAAANSWVVRAREALATLEEALATWG